MSDRVESAPPPGPQTRLALEAYRISGRAMPLAVMHAIALIKSAAAHANADLGAFVSIDADLAAAIAGAADEVAAGTWDDQLTVDVFQTGSGTASHMVVNELVAALASQRSGRPVHPNDDVNAAQSSNDVVPTAIRISVARRLHAELVPAIDAVEAALAGLATRAGDAVKVGRTHLMDAAPLFARDEIGAWAAELAAARAVLDAAAEGLLVVPLGGSAVGTGLNVPDGWADAVVADLATRTGLALERGDAFAGLAGAQPYLQVSAALRGVALAATKIANDLRLLASGPATGFGEYGLPKLAAGSSIMPGKVNPVVPEVVVQVGARVVGNDTVIATAATQAHLQLFAMQPVIADALHESIGLLTNALRLFADRCIAGAEVDAERMAHLAERSPAIVTALTPVIGYDAAAGIVAESLRSGRSVIEVARDTGLDPVWLADALDLATLARGGLTESG